MLKESLGISAGVVWLGTLLVACQAGPEDAEVPADTHSVVGTIASVTLRDDGYVDLVIEDGVSEPRQISYDTVDVLILDTTPLWIKEVDGSLSPATKEDLVVGNLIRAYFSGIMWRIDPPGFIASRVEITRRE